MSWLQDGRGWALRVAISIGVILLVFVAGVRTSWMTVSKAAPATNEDRAYEAAVLGETRADATSGELIDAAVTRGEISSDQGLLYGVYLACDDARLPVRYRGVERMTSAKNILWEADVDWASLSPDTQATLEALFTPEPAARSKLGCRDEIERLQSDPNVWWGRALQRPMPDALPG